MWKFAATSLFAAIIFLLSFTPFGFIKLGFINATTIHVPVIIGSILLGPRAGACLGFMFGLASLIAATVSPTILSFAFSPLVPVPGSESGSLWALVICFAPRILIGAVPWYAAKISGAIAKRMNMPSVIPLAIAGAAGSLTNTVPVMYLIFFIFKDAFALARDMPVNLVHKTVLSVIAFHGIPEALLAAVLSPAICAAVEAYRRGEGTGEKL